MSKRKKPIRFTGQHFTIDKPLINKAIKLTNVEKGELVLDIGAGKGNITQELLKSNCNIIAIENDLKLVEHLHSSFDMNKVRIVAESIDYCLLPEKPFKVVSNIPYHHTSSIMKKLMFDYLAYFEIGTIVLQYEVALKMCNAFSYNPYLIYYHANYEIQFIQRIGKKSFYPPPKVDSALIFLKRKDKPLISSEHKEKFVRFLFFMLKQPERSSKTVLKQLFRKRQVYYLEKKMDLTMNSKIVEFNVVQWVKCFGFMLEVVPDRFHP